MTSMDIEMSPSEYLGHKEHSNADSKKKSNRIFARRDSGTIADAIKDSMRIPSPTDVSFMSWQLCFKFVYVKQKLLSFISDPNGRFILLGVFTSIVMVIGILIVYYTSPKPPGMFFLDNL